MAKERQIALRLLVGFHNSEIYSVSLNANNSVWFFDGGGVGKKDESKQK